MKWYRKAMKQGFVAAQYNLGLCYINGDGVAKNINKGIELLTGAAKQGQGDAALALGNIYRFGIGVELNFEMAKKWYKEAVKLNAEGAEDALAEIESKSSFAKADEVLSNKIDRFFDRLFS